MNFLKGAWSAVFGFFGGLNITLIEVGLAVAITLGVTVGAYEAGRHSMQADIAKNNAKVALIYAANVKSANDATQRERDRADSLAKENTDLKEQVKNVAQGNASPGVDAATHGLRQTAPARHATVPRPKR